MWLITTELGLTPGRGPSGDVMLHVSPERAGEMVLVVSVCLYTLLKYCTSVVSVFKNLPGTERRCVFVPSRLREVDFSFSSSRLIFCQKRLACISEGNLMLSVLRAPSLRCLDMKVRAPQALAFVAHAPRTTRHVRVFSPPRDSQRWGLCVFPSEKWGSHALLIRGRLSLLSE